MSRRPKHALSPILVPFLIAAALPVIGCDDEDTLMAPGLNDGGGTDAIGTIGSGQGDAAAPAGPDCMGLAQAFCGAFDRCAKIWVPVAYGSLDVCVTRFRQQCESDVAAPGSGVTVANARACQQAVEGTSCKDLFENRLTGCDLQGALANGQTCQANAQCQSGLCRREAACGVCSTKGAAGSACRDNEQCLAGLVCPEREGDRRCAKPGAAGDGCSEDSPCGYGLHCKGGLCAPVGAAGAPCQGEGSCNGLAGLYCNEGAKVCQIANTATPGQACGVVNGTYTLCTGGGHCAGAVGVIISGVCATPAEDGGPCGARAQGRQCLSPAVCVEGTCRLPGSMMCL